MIYENDLMKIFQADHDKMLSYGFSFENKKYIFKKNVHENNFRIEIIISENEFSLEVYDNGFDDPYELFSIGTAAGDFVMKLRHEADELINDIVEKCFIKIHAREKVLEYVKNNFDAIIDNPFSHYPDFVVFKTKPNEKWFGLFFDISLSQLGGEGEEIVEAVNLKLDPKVIEELIDFETYFPAWHMNKTHWVTVVFAKGVDWTRLLEFIHESYNNVK